MKTVSLFCPVWYKIPAFVVWMLIQVSNSCQVCFDQSNHRNLRGVIGSTWLTVWLKKECATVKITQGCSLYSSCSKCREHPRGQFGWTNPLSLALWSPKREANFALFFLIYRTSNCSLWQAAVVHASPCRANAQISVVSDRQQLHMHHLIDPLYR